MTERQIDEWGQLEERSTHSETMKPLNPLEATWLEDYRTHGIYLKLKKGD